MRTRTYGLDSSTIQYAQRIKSGAGVALAPERLKEINKFVVGIKRMGLWDKMVCWPMRSIHNAGTGSTVYSLGGVINNASLINGIAWDRDGIISYGSQPTKLIRTNFTISGVNFTIGYVIRHLQVNITTAFDVQGSSGPSQNNITQIFRRSYNGVLQWDRWLQGTSLSSVVQTDSSSRSFLFAASLNIGVEARIQTNNQFVANSSASAIAGSQTTVDYYKGISGLDGIYHFIFGFNRYLTQSESLSFYNIYKQTIGRSLGLV